MARQVPTLPIDIALDCFFLLDIVVNFNMATMGGGDTMLEFNDDRWQVRALAPAPRTPPRHFPLPCCSAPAAVPCACGLVWAGFACEWVGVDVGMGVGVGAGLLLRQVTKNYLKQGFMFDLCTSIPVRLPLPTASPSALALSRALRSCHSISLPCLLLLLPRGDAPAPRACSPAPHRRIAAPRYAGSTCRTPRVRLRLPPPAPPACVRLPAVSEQRGRWQVSFFELAVQVECQTTKNSQMGVDSSQVGCWLLEARLGLMAAV